MVRLTFQTRPKFLQTFFCGFITKRSLLFWPLCSSVFQVKWNSDEVQDLEVSLWIHSVLSDGEDASVVCPATLKSGFQFFVFLTTVAHENLCSVGYFPRLTFFLNTTPSCDGSVSLTVRNFNWQLWLWADHQQNPCNVLFLKAPKSQSLSFQEHRFLNPVFVHFVQDCFVGNKLFEW